MVTQGTILSQRYLLEEEIGTGGMGTVYRAVDLRTGARVAVKVPHAFLIRDRQYVERLRREAQIAASLHSSRVAHVTDFAEQDGVPYLVMEFVPGESLADRLAQSGALPPEEALRIALEITRALEAAHAAGIVHRDLKPHNIHLVGDGDIKVMDFGIARVQGQTSLTANSLFLGSPDYAAPERAEGEGDIRSDIYSVGITLYEMLTGRLPFGSGTPWTILRRQVSEPPPPLPPGLPSMVYPIVARCLEKRPDERYQVPQQLVQDLSAALRQLDRDRDIASRSATHAGVPLHASDVTQPLPPAPPAPPASPAPPAAPPPAPAAVQEPPRRRSRAPLIAGSVLALLVLLGAGALLLRRGGSTDQAPTTQAEEATTTSATATGTSVPTAGAGGGAAAASIRFTQPAEGARLAGPVTVKVQTNGINLKPATANVAGGQHLHFFVDLDPALVVGPGQPVPTGQAGIIHTASPEQSFPDLAPGPHTIAVVVTGNDHRPLTPSVQQKVSFTVLPDISGARAAAAAPIAFQSLVNGKWAIVTITGDGRNPRRITSGSANDLSPAWSPDGKQIAFQSDREGAPRIFVMNADGSGVRRLTSGPGNDRSPAWSPDGKFIVFQSDRDGRDLLYVIPAGGGEVRQLTKGQGSDARPAWSPDGALIAFSSNQNGSSRLFTVPAGGGDPVEVQTGVGNDIDPAWSPDGTRLAFASSREGRWDIYVVSLEGGQPKRVTESRANVVNVSPSWSPDAKQIVFQSDREGQQNVFVMPAEGGQAKRLSEGTSLNLAPTWPMR